MFENEALPSNSRHWPLDPGEQVELSYVIQVFLSTLSRTRPMGGLGELAPPTGCGAELHYNKIHFVPAVLFLN